MRMVPIGNQESRCRCQICPSLNELFDLNLWYLQCSSLLTRFSSNFSAWKIDYCQNLRNVLVQPPPKRAKKITFPAAKLICESFLSFSESCPSCKDIWYHFLHFFKILKTLLVFKLQYLRQRTIKNYKLYPKIWVDLFVNYTCSNFWKFVFCFVFHAWSNMNTFWVAWFMYI